MPLRVVRRDGRADRGSAVRDTADRGSAVRDTADRGSADRGSADWSLWDGGEVIELNDQHAYLRLDEGAVLAPGDLVCLGISHPCTTLDKWRVIPVVNDDDRVTDTVHAMF